MSDIEVRHLSKSFDLKGVKVEALKDINLSIKPGDIYGIIGMSGAGKSTLVRCLNFLERPTEGEVLVGGKDLSTLTEKELRKQRQEIAMIFQHFNLLMQKNVIDNICFPLLLRGEKKADARRRAMELLKLVDLEEKANAYPSQLSGGQKQRVAIARALASDPKILLCDEATSALDPQTTASILALLKDINEKFGITIVIITHQMAVIREICKHVAILNHGVLVEEGEVEEIFNHPKSEAARELILGDISENQWNGETRQKERVLEDKCLRDVVPIHFGGQNSERFYRIARFSDKHLPFNLAMLFLVDEMYKNVGKHFRIAIGKPIPWQTFDKSKSATEWAQYVEDKVYEL